MANITSLPGNPCHVAPVTGDEQPSAIATHLKVRRKSWQGVINDGVECYYGIRYARLLNPGQPRSESVAADGQLVVDTMSQVPVFPQLPSRLETVTGTAGRLNPQDNEAFYLNIWAPAGADRLPVMVFIHGGAWASGGGTMQWYRGQRLAAEGMVVVTVNYRLGPAGHLEDTSGTNRHRPFQDLQLALQWVADNITQFGGDPGQTTLAGQSAGAWYTWALASLPGTQGLFQQIALLSIPEITPWGHAYRHRFSMQVTSLANQEADETETLRQLRAGAKALALTPRIAGAMPPMYLPTLGGEDAHILSGAAIATKHMHVNAVYLRITQHEMSVFLPAYEPGSDAFKATAQLLNAKAHKESLPDYPTPAQWDDAWANAVKQASWFEFGRFTEQIAVASRHYGHHVIVRDFAALSGQPAMGAVHCMDLPFQFGNRADWTDAPMLAGWSNDAFEAVSAEVRQDIAAFVCGHARPERRVLGLTP